LVGAPVTMIAQVGAREFPRLGRIVQPRDESLPLLVARQMQHQLEDRHPVTGQVFLEGVDVLVALPPERFRAMHRTVEPTFRQPLGMHAHHQHVLVVGAIEHADTAAQGQTSLVATKEVLTQLRRAWIGDYETLIALYGQANSGRPYSIAFNGTIDPYGFTPFLDFRTNVLEPGVERNGEDGSWWRKLDLRVSQELPGFGPDHRAKAFFVIDNLTNLLNDEWGILRQHNFPRTVEAGTEEPRIGDASRYEIRFGVEYNF